MAGKAEQIGRRIVATRDLLCTSKEFKHRRPVETTPPGLTCFSTNKSMPLRVGKRLCRLPIFGLRRYKGYGIM